MMLLFSYNDRNACVLLPVIIQIAQFNLNTQEMIIININKHKRRKQKGVYSSNVRTEHGWFKVSKFFVLLFINILRMGI